MTQEFSGVLVNCGQKEGYWVSQATEESENSETLLMVQEGGRCSEKIRSLKNAKALKYIDRNGDLWVNSIRVVTYDDPKKNDEVLLESLTRESSIRRLEGLEGHWVTLILE